MTERKVTHGFAMKLAEDDEGVTRRIEVNMTDDHTFHIEICTQRPDAEPFLTRIGFSRIGMQLLAQAVNEAALNMHKWKLPESPGGNN